MPGIMSYADKDRSSACRCLFGPVDHEQIRRDFRREMKVWEDEARAKWSFDFKEGMPLSGGKYDWEEMQTENMPNMYIKSPRLPSMKRTPAKRGLSIRDENTAPEVPSPLKKPFKETTSILQDRLLDLVSDFYKKDDLLLDVSVLPLPTTAEASTQCLTTKKQRRAIKSKSRKSHVQKKRLRQTKITGMYTLLEVPFYVS